MTFISPAINSIRIAEESFTAIQKKEKKNETPIRPRYTEYSIHRQTRGVNTSRNHDRGDIGISNTRIRITMK
jgi:hypothetical protein